MTRDNFSISKSSGATSINFKFQKGAGIEVDPIVKRHSVIGQNGPLASNCEIFGPKTLFV